VQLLRRLARSIWLRLLVSAALLAFVISRINLGDARERLSGGHWGYFVAAVVVLFASFIVGALRWHIYLTAAGVDLPTAGAVRAYLIGMFANNFMPTQLGGDAARAWIVSRPGSRLRSATTVVVDRATALLCLMAVGWLAIAANPEPVPGQIVAALGALTAAFVLGTLVLFALSRSARLRRKLPDRFLPYAAEIRQALAACLRPAILSRTLAIGLAFQGLVGLAAWFVGRSISIDAPFSVLAASLAPVLLVAAAPVSIGGFGVREGAYVLLLGYASISSTDATLFSLLSAAAFAIASLPGAFALLFRRGAAPTAAGADPGSRAGTT